MSLLTQIKKLAKDINDDLVTIAENDGVTGCGSFDEGYCDGLREYHLQLIELISRFEDTEQESEQ